jgi:hypothetical protein
MKPEDHAYRISRIERTLLSKLDPHADYELYVEACMLAGTHALNFVLHRLELTAETWDLAHSDTPAHDIRMPAELALLVAGLKSIEDLRASSLRGKSPWNPGNAERCLEGYRALREYLAKLS